MNRKKLKLILIFTIGLLLLPFAFGGTFYFLKVMQEQRSEEAELRQLASLITVRVLLDNTRGSGVLIEKDGQVYTVLTNAHVARSGKSYRIQTPDGKSYPAEFAKVKKHDYDMTILQFTADADANYQVATLKKYIKRGKLPQPVFAAGFSDNARKLVLTRGELSMLASQPLKEGYQIGYTNEVVPGMSGGPVLNAEGKLIGINGMGDPIRRSAYEFPDGSYPNDEDQEKMNFLNWGVPIQRVAEVYPPDRLSAVVPAEVKEEARKITVRIEWPDNNGSGAIVAQRGQTYYVLTAAHVVDEEREYKVVAHDSKQYLVDYGKVKKLEGVDLAVLQFQSQESYEVATLAKYNLKVDEKPWIFLSGWPALKRIGELRSLRPEFTAGRVFSKERGALVGKDPGSFTKGYELVYSNLTEGGMSGGPVLDTKGRVIGIHAATEVDDKRRGYRMGYSLGVPVRTFLSLASRMEVKPEWSQVEESPPPSLNAIEELKIIEALSIDKKPPPGESAEDWVNYGNQSWRLFRYEEAVEAFDEAIKLKQDLYQAWYGRGLALKSQGNYQAAATSFEKAAEIEQKFYQAWRQRADALASLGKYSEALASIDKAIKINSEDSVLYWLRGLILQESGSYAEAVVAYNKAIEIKPHPFAYNNRGIARSDNGDKKEAIADFTKAIEIKPDHAGAYNNRGLARYELEDYEEAIADYDKAIELNPDFAEAYYNRGNARSDKEDYEGALADYNRSIKINRDDAAAYNNRGVVRSYLGDYEGAIADYDKAIEIDPDFAEAYYNRGNARSDLGDKEGALADYDKAIDINPEYAVAYNKRGIVRSDLGNYEGAIADYNRAIEINPDYAEVYNNRGVARSDLGDKDGAIADYDKAIEIDPEYADYYTNRANARSDLGDKDGALTDYDKAIEIDPDDAAAYNNRGRVREKLGEDERAIADYDKAAQIFCKERSPYCKIAQENLRRLQQKLDSN
ncbi:MAG: tetratricopeptide repeat protein [Hormoscilla sp.]